MNLEQIIEEMKAVFKDIPQGVDHTNRVLRNTELIMDIESVSDETR